MNSLDALTQFHFLRPWWLLSLAPALLASAWMLQQKFQAKQWQQLIAPELLPFLLDGKTTRAHPGYILGLAFAWIISAIALAGPSWEKRPVAMEKNQHAMVIMLDLSPSMLSEDVKPSRLVRARLKIADILRQRKDGFTALIVYGGDAHVVTPLTDDVKTINNLLPDLNPNIMPLPGSNTEAAIERAMALLHDAGMATGELLLVTDGITNDAQQTLTTLLKSKPDFHLAILGVGTANPTPIPSNKGGFIRDKRGNIVTTQLTIEELQTLAQQTGGLYHTMTDTSTDVQYLVRPVTPQASDSQRVDREFDSWYDRGHWLVLLLLPAILYCFRRGVLPLLFILPLLGLNAPKSYALSWDDLWKNKDQQAYKVLNQENPKEAAELFENSDWKATAEYRAGNYAEAAKEFAKNTSAQGHYNRGNALAKTGQIDEAIKAYDQALQQDSNLTDAKKNRDLLEALKKQQQQKQNSDQKNQDKQQNNDQQDNNQKNKSDDQNNQQDQQSSSAAQKSDQQQSDQQQENQQQNPQESDQQQNSPQNSSSGSAHNQQQQENNNKGFDQGSSANSDQQASPKPIGQQTSSAASEDQMKTQNSEGKSSSGNPSQSQSSSADNQAQQALTDQAPDDGMTNEERQAMEQWLRRVPDEPGLLLKNKFRDQYQKRRMQMYNGEWQAPENGADERW